MPFTLVIAALAGLAFVVRAGHDAWRLWQASWVHPLDYINIVVGLLFLGSIAHGRAWLRPMGLTLGGVLLVQSVFVFFGMTSANGMKGNPGVGYANAINVALYAARFAFGVFLLWCMRRPDVTAWIVRRSGHDV
ncbi:MAG: hypothetical protein JNK56_23535 [Myxococcales bacterium]|nr:hypothetical protein [Myxococcales bacterium]